MRTYACGLFNAPWRCAHISLPNSRRFQLCMVQTLIVSASMLLLSFAPALAQNTSVSPDNFIGPVVETVYQPRYEKFARQGRQFMQTVQQSCLHVTNESVSILRDQFEHLVAAFSDVELFRVGPALEANRSNRLFFWPDKRRVGERQLRALLSDAKTIHITENQLVQKSVALQGLPALERLLFSNQIKMYLSDKNKALYCNVLTAIAQNVSSMANALNESWSTETEFLGSLYQPQAGSDYFRTEREVLSSLVTQVIVGISVVLDRKLKPLVADDGRWTNAPLWMSGQSMPMIRGNMNSIRALVMESGLARRAGLENELTFEFGTVEGMLSALITMPVLLDNSGQLNEEARSLIRALTATVGGISSTLDDRFTKRLGVSASFNSEDGD